MTSYYRKKLDALVEYSGILSILESVPWNTKYNLGIDTVQYLVMQQILEKISVSIARMIMPVATYRDIKGTESQLTILFVKRKIIIAEAKGMEIVFI